MKILVYIRKFNNLPVSSTGTRLLNLSICCHHVYTSKTAILWRVLFIYQVRNQLSHYTWGHYRLQLEGDEVSKVANVIWILSSIQIAYTSNSLQIQFNYKDHMLPLCNHKLQETDYEINGIWWSSENKPIALVHSMYISILPTQFNTFSHGISKETILMVIQVQTFPPGCFWFRFRKRKGKKRIFQWPNDLLISSKLWNRIVQEEEKNSIK